MKSCNNNSGCNNGYPYPKQSQVEDSSIITFWNGCRYVGVPTKDFITAAKLGLLDNLDGLQDGDVLMVEGDKVVASGLRYDDDLQALVYTGKIIADEIEVSTDTIFISQRIAIEAFGNSVEFRDNFDNERRLPVYTKIGDQGSLGNFSVQVGVPVSVPVQSDSNENYTGFNYAPPVVIGSATASTVSFGNYRFSSAGVNARIKVTAEKPDGSVFALFGTEAYPYKEFVSVEYDGTEATETIVEYPGGIYNTEGLTYTTVIETYDPVTREISSEPLNILGSTASGVFRAYVVVSLQVITEVELSGQGDVIGSSGSSPDEIPVYSDASGKIIESSGVLIQNVLEIGNNVSDLLNDAFYISEVVHDDTLAGKGIGFDFLGVSLRTVQIDENTTEIYKANDSFDRFYFTGDQDSTLKLKSEDGDYNDRCRFQVYNDSGYNLTLTENDGTEIQRIRNGFAFEFFYDDGWGFGLIRRLGAQGIEIDVANLSQFQLNGFYANKTVVFVHNTTPTVSSLDITVEPFNEFSNGDLITIVKDESITFPFMNVDFERSNGELVPVVVTGSVVSERRQQRWVTISNDERQNIAIVSNVNLPYNTRGMNSNAFSAIATIYAENVAVSEKLAENGIDRLLTVDLNQFVSQGEIYDLEGRFGVNDWFDNGPAAEYQQAKPIQFLEMECNGGYIHQVVHQDFGYTTYLRVYFGNNNSKGVEFKDSTGRVSGRKTVRVGEIWKVTSAQKDTIADVYWERIDDGTAGYVMDEDLVESFEANNDLILAPNSGVEFYLKDSDKDLGYGLNNVSTYFQPADGAIDLNASDYLDYGQVYAVHKKVNSNKCLMMIHQNLVSELWGQPVDGVNKLSMVVKSGAKAALGMVNQTAPTGGVWNYQGFAIDIATTSDNANTTNPTKYLKDDGTEATVIADYARAIYSSGTFKNDGTTLLARGVVNFTANTATPNTFTEDDTSDYFVCSVTIGGGTFGQFKMMPVFMTKSSSSDMYDKKAVLFDDAASAVGELLTICYDGAEEASAIAEAAKTSDSFGEFKQKIEQTTITESI